MSSANEAQNLRIDPATLGDLDDLVELVMELFSLEEDFQPDRRKQQHGLKLILQLKYQLVSNFLFFLLY